jgi:diadenosine tetraphosphate (Ap4A) HIT family hydrolase/5-methylcytosine-specific restriction endonuclease McrA
MRLARRGRQNMPDHSHAFSKLEQFIREQMRMSHIYQPVMLIELLRRGGKAKIRDIAKALLVRDESQIEYYEVITKNMVGRVLTKNRGLTEREDDAYSLKGFEELSPAEINDLVHLCQEKIEAYIERRGRRIWEHRTNPAGYISGTLKYEVLKLAKFRCELCGISAEEKALETDHIIPRNRGGTDDLSNLQALCYSCNAMKRDRDDTDFRAVAASYNSRESGCIFCQDIGHRTIAKNEHCYAVRDAYPVTPLHTLVIPRRHVRDYFDLYQPELNAINRLLSDMKSDISSFDPAVAAFNIGVNAGADAGQTTFHCHVHLIPRRHGDVSDPRGGVRGVVPSQQHYGRDRG